MTTAKKVVKQKPLTKLEAAERKASILECAIYQQYNDIDEQLAVLWLISKEADSPNPNMYQIKQAINAYRGLLISNQSLMMDCAGLEY